MGEGVRGEGEMEIIVSPHTHAIHQAKSSECQLSDK